MVTRRILATSGGFPGTDRWNVRRVGPMVLNMLALTGKERPRVCFVHTASGDDKNYLTMSYEALSSINCDVTHLELFPQPNADVEERICGSDLVWVGGGSVANLLSLWRLHQVDAAMRQAWESGVILGGVSAGSICWHVGGTTDSFGPQLRPVTDGLALIPFGNGVHYDSEEQRRPLLHSLVQDGTMPTSYATDDRVGILYEGTDAVAVLRDVDGDPAQGPAAYHVEKVGDGVVETRLAEGRI
jgi:peptidase E